MSKRLICAIFLAHHTALVVGSGQAGKAQALLSSNLNTSVANLAPLNEEGYQLVVRYGGGDADMKLFIGRLLLTLHRAVDDLGAFNGFVPHYSGSVAIQNFASLKNELEVATWTRLRHVDCAQDAIAGTPTIPKTSSSVVGQMPAAVGAGIEAKVAETVESSLESQATANVRSNASSGASSSLEANATETRELHERDGSDFKSLNADATTKSSAASMERSNQTSSVSTAANGNDTRTASAQATITPTNASSASSPAKSSSDKTSATENLEAAKIKHKISNATSAKATPGSNKTSYVSTAANENDTRTASAQATIAPTNASSASSPAKSSGNKTSSAENLEAVKIEHKIPNATSTKATPINNSLAEPSSALGVAQESFNMTVAKPAAATPSFRAGEMRHRAPAVPRSAAARQARGPADTKTVAADPSSESSSFLGKVLSQIRGAVQHVLGGPEQQHVQPQARQHQSTRAQHHPAKRSREEVPQQKEKQDPAQGRASDRAIGAPRALNSHAITGFLGSSPKGGHGTEEMTGSGELAPKDAESDKSVIGKSAEDKAVAEKTSAERGVEQKAAAAAVASKEAAKEKAAAAKAGMDNAAIEQDAAVEIAVKPAAAEHTAETAAEEGVAKERGAAEISTGAKEHETSMEEAAAKRSVKTAAEKTVEEKATTEKAPVQKSTADATKTSLETRVEQTSVAGTGMATAGRAAADKVDTKKAMSEKVGKEREAAGAERASRLAKAREERDAKMAKVKAERAAKLAKIRADRTAQSLEKERVKNHSLALRTQMHDGVEQSFSESRISRAASMNLDTMLDSAPETQAAAVAAEEALRTSGMKSPPAHLQRHAQVSAKLPDVDSLLAPAAGRFRVVQAQAKAIQDQVHAQVDASRAALAQKVRSYEQQLAEHALNSQAVANASQGIRSSIAAQSKSNAELEQEAQLLLKARAVLRRALDGLVPKLALAKSFLADSLNITNDVDSQALNVLRPTTPAPTLEHYLGLARQSLGVTHSDHHVALLETSSQTKSRRNPLEDEERKPNTASDVLAGRLIELRGQHESGAAELSSHYSHLLEEADAYHASLLAEQISLNTTLASLRQSNEGLKSARTYLQSHVQDLESRLASFRSFVGHLGSSLNELTTRANTELDGMTLSPALKAASSKALHQGKRATAGVQRQRKVAQ